LFCFSPSRTKISVNARSTVAFDSGMNRNRFFESEEIGTYSNYVFGFFRSKKEVLTQEALFFGKADESGTDSENVKKSEHILILFLGFFVQKKNRC